MVGKFSELSANYLWRNKIWRIAIWSMPLAVKFWSSVHVTCIYYMDSYDILYFNCECEMTACTFCIDSMVRGYCQYQSIWDIPLADGDLPCE